jgi:hypothetical protein
MTVLVFIGVSAFFNLVGSLVVYYEPGLSTAIMPILCIEFFTNFATDSYALSSLANLLATKCMIFDLLMSSLDRTTNTSSVHINSLN